ncbi:MAG: hypothetical protein ACJA2B_000135 [Candidatus Endobugula sp.]|jgi:hypothetical protein
MFSALKNEGIKELVSVLDGWLSDSATEKESTAAS